MQLERLERLERTLNDLKEDPRPKLVEGRKDREALAHFGISNVKLVHGNALRDMAAKMHQDVILLMDYDRRGKMMTRRLSDLFHGEGYVADLSFWKDLRRYGRLNVIEELVARYNELKDYDNRMREKRRKDIMKKGGI